MSDHRQAAKERRRHIKYWRILRFVARPLLRIAVGYTAQKAPSFDAPVLVLSNHNADVDAALVALSFKEQMYFVASEHVFRWGWISRFIQHAFAPLPLVKGRSDARAALSIMKALREGKNVCIFAEGNRSADGITAPISPATGMLAKTGADLVTYRLTGGYFTHPRWAKGMRKGRMTGQVVGHYTAAQLKEMSVDEINGIIRRDLYEDAYARQKLTPVAFRGKRLAEHLETVLYLCPECGEAGRLKSAGNRLSCACGLNATFAETGMLEGADLRFHTVAEWYAWQLAQVDVVIQKAKGSPIFMDARQSLYQIDPCKSSTLLAKGDLFMTDTLLSVAGHGFPLVAIDSMVIVGQMTVIFVLDDGRRYEIKSDTPRSGYKYLHALEALGKRAARQNTSAKGS